MRIGQIEWMQAQLDLLKSIVSDQQQQIRTLKECD